MLGIGMLRHPKMTMQHGTLRIDLQRSSEMIFRQIVLLLPEINGTESVPRVVMPLVAAKRVPITSGRAIEILVGHVLVPGERVAVGEGGIQLYAPAEEGEGRLVLFLEGEAIPHDAPTLRAELVEIDGALGQVTELDFFLEMPQGRAQDFQAGHAVRFEFLHVCQRALRVGVVCQFEVRASDLVLDPTRLVLPRGKGGKDLEGFVEFVMAEQFVCRG